MLDGVLEDTAAQADLNEATKVVEALEKEHGYTKLQKRLVVFKVIGTANFLSVKDQINLTRRECLKSEPGSWHTLALHVYLADVFAQLDADAVAVKELKFMEDVLTGQKYKTVKYGYLFKSKFLAKRLWVMSKFPFRYEAAMKEDAKEARAFMEEAGFNDRRVLIT